ncbi:hypothetical protein HZH68_011330 [Vespula germanica]|uniref:Uncharacterized protein n=1 Tax=Vespula germanica TaxID=30212 RepID=A0A834N0C9_VESGE|nr:hypothetical protein HZH68_011330 [Vespula germanica]
MAPGKRFARDTVVPTYLVPKVGLVVGSSGGNGGGGGGDGSGGGILTTRRFNGGVGCRGEAENLARRLGGYFTRAGAKNVHFKGERITTSASHFPLERGEEDREKDTEEYKDEESRARSFHGIRGGFLRFVEESTTARSRTTKGGGCGVAMVVARAPPPRAPLAGSSLETRESVRNYDQRCGRFSDERRQQFNSTHTRGTALHLMLYKDCSNNTYKLHLLIFE